MIISEIVPVEILYSTVEENTSTFDNTQQVNFPRNMKLESGGGIYQFIGDYVFSHDEMSAPPIYLEASEDIYVVGDVIFKNNKITRVVSTGEASIAQQPSEYPVTIGFDQTAWNYRYAHLISGIIGIFDGFDHDDGDVKHKLYRDPETWGWKYSISYTESEWVYEEERYDRSTYTYLKYVSNDSSIEIWYEGTNVYSGEDLDPESSQLYFEGNDGIKYKRGSFQEVVLEPEDGSHGYYLYAVFQGRENIETIVQTEDTAVSGWCDKDIYEDIPMVLDSTDAGAWLGKFFILENDNLYVRTSVDTAVIPKDVTTPQYVVINMLDNFPNFAFIGVSDRLKPIDGRNNSILKRSGSIGCTIGSRFKFDTLAFSGVIAKAIWVEFKSSDGTTIRHISEYKPNTHRDPAGNLPRVGTTAIFYSPQVMEPGDTIEISLSGSNIQIGEMLLGVKAYAGKTNFLFNNKGKPIAPIEKDGFGAYHNRKASVDVFSGSADFKVLDYDMIGRFLKSVNGMKVIANGSDSDEIENGETRFAKTRTIGILMLYGQATKADKKHMDEIATVDFTIEEVV